MPRDVLGLITSIRRRPAGRDWLAGQLEAVGAQVRTCVAYVRSAPAWDAPQRALDRLFVDGGRLDLAARHPNPGFVDHRVSGVGVGHADEPAGIVRQLVKRQRVFQRRG